MKKSFVILLSVILIATVLFGCAEKTHTTSDTRDESSSAVQNDKEKTESDSKTKENKNDNNGKADTTKKTGNVAENEKSTTDAETKTAQSNKQEDTDMEHTKVKFTMENGGEFVMELYPEYAPETVANFEKLVSEGFYSGLIFHRVISGFMAQGGDPTGTGMGGSKETIKGEFAANGFSQNTLSHQRGVVSMARSQMPNSASSQFFICFGNESFLDGNYAAFGKVIEGMDVVDEFATIATDSSDRPTEDIVIKSAEIVK